MLYNNLAAHYATLSETTPDTERLAVLQPLIDYVQHKIEQQQEVVLNFICTHNSRRSQFAQMHAAAAAHFYGIDLKSLSGGVEITAFNPNAVQALQSTGFQIKTDEESSNPRYRVAYASDVYPATAFSKLFDDAINQAEAFAAVMTCSNADENCPFIPGTEKRIALNYEDPKAFDGTPEVAERYLERSNQIAAEMLHVFKQAKEKIS